MSENISELFHAMAMWALSKGAVNVGASGKLWVGTTEADEHFSAPVKVEMNGTNAEIDDVPAFNARLSNEKYFPGIMGLINPYGGMLIAAGPGDEDKLIQHFRAQTKEQADA